jgi:anti-sigma regulatory factor (Ser/Thr protein kinase)
VAQRQDQGPDFELRIRAEAEQLHEVRHELGSWLDGHGAAPEVAAEIALAVHEAAANVVEHAYGPDDGVIELRAECDGDEVTLEIRDHGRWRTPRGEDHGRGTPMMNVLVDAAEVETDGDGTRVTMRKRLVRAGGERSTTSAD